MAEATSLRRGVDLLTALGTDDAVAAGGYGVNRLAELTGQDKGNVSRMLRVLAETGLVERDPRTRSFRLGWRLYAIAARSGHQRLLQLAPAHLRHLVEQSGERSHLSVLQGHDVLTVLTQSTPRAVQTAGWVGRPVPACCTSSGRALLLDHDLVALRQLFEGVVFSTGNAGPADVDALHERIVASRAHGYAITDEEFEAGLVAVAAPVRDYSGAIVAALNVSAPKFRLGDRLPETAEAIRASAERLSTQLGWTAPVAAEPQTIS
jgi:IclR family KDG regulon transcriptional repressor